MPRAALLALLLAVCGSGGAAAERYEISPPAPGTCPTEDGIARIANTLLPGDELVLRDGTYCQTGRRLIEVSGRPDRLIVIRAAAGAAPILTRPDDPRGPQRHQGTEVRGAHLILRGLRFHRGIRGLVFHAGAHHITVEDCEVAYTANNGLTLNNGDTDSFIIRRNHIHHTGNLAPELGETEGEGMYIGCNWAECIASNHLIENNHIHHLKATSHGGNDGIELKYGAHGNVVRGNVIHTILPGWKDIRFPCINASGVRDRDIAAPNLIEGNRLSGCGEAIQAIADAVIRDNLVVNSETALATYNHEQVPVQRNVHILNNTFYGTSVALEFGVNAGTGAARKPAPTGIVFSGNAVYGWGLRPLLTVNLPLGGDVTIRNNAVEGLSETGRLRIVATGGLTLDDAAFFDGRSAPDAFIDPAGGDFRPTPGSPLDRHHVGCCGERR